MGLLLLGILSGAICAGVAFFLGAPWWGVLLTYSLAGTCGTLANALWHVLHQPSDRGDRTIGDAARRNADRPRG